jgi:hypothetical protein
VLNANLPHVDAALVQKVVSLLQAAHKKGGVLTPRDGISIARFTQRLVKTGASLDKALATALATVADEKRKRA